jgi:hypothetical protein
LVIALALHENNFAAPVVKHQDERDQRVIDSGGLGDGASSDVRGLCFVYRGPAPTSRRHRSDRTGG